MNQRDKTPQSRPGRSTRGTFILLATLLASGTLVGTDSRGATEALSEAEQAPLVETYSGRQGFRVKLGLSKPEFTQVRYFDRLYGKTSFLMPTLELDRMYAQWDFVSLGLGFSMAGYRKSGHEVHHPSGETPSPEELKPAAGGLALTLIPYRFFVVGQIRPFPADSMLSFINFDLWAGYEELYYQEVRVTAQDDKAASGLRAPRRRSSAPSTASSPELINTGWNSHLVLGGALNLRMNGLDEKSVRSLRKTLGIHSVYFAPFFEISTPLASKTLFGYEVSKASFARQVVGVGFTFEGFM